MPDWYPVAGDALHIIQPCKNFIIRLPSENFKVVDLKPKTTIHLGKFGSFFADELIGKPFGPSWEILPNKEIKLFVRENQDEGDDDVFLRDNRDVFDDKAAQQLTHGQIKEARATLSSKEIIETISAHNINFDKKSVFSQEKYVRTKEQRFLKAFTPVQPTVGNVCEYLWEDKRERCMDLSTETIGLMLSLANVCAGGRYLVIDETSLIVAAILERGGSVFLLHENQEPNIDTLKYFPHLQNNIRQQISSDTQSENPDLTFLSMDFLSAIDSSSVSLVPPMEGPDRQIYERKMRTYNRELEIHKIWNESLFDGFISVSTLDPESYLQRFVERVELSGNVVVYSPYRETVVLLQQFILTKMPTRPILAPMIHDIRAQRWNTLKGRMRPDMLGRGGGGCVLAGTRVEDGDPEQPDWIDRRKKRKVQENGIPMRY